MTPVVTRVLIINDNIDFVVRMKQALEKLGRFEVSPFTGAETAFEHLQVYPYDVAMVDFNLPGMPTMDIILRLRSIQPDIAIILSPDLPEVGAIVRDMKLNGIVNAPCSARELIPVVEKAVAQIHDVLPDTAEAPIVENESDTLLMDRSPDAALKPEFSSLGNVLVHTGGFDIEIGTETIDVNMHDAEYAKGSENTKTIEFVLTGDLNALRLLADHPTKQGDTGLASHPKPADDEVIVSPLEGTGSVLDLRAEITESDLHEIAEAIKQDQGWPLMPPANELKEAESRHSSPAQIILETALEETTAPSAVSLEDLLQSIIRRFPEKVEGVKPLPSWIRDIEQYVREPAFLEDPLPEIEQTDRSNIQTTRMSDPGELESKPGEIMTERILDETPFEEEYPSTTVHADTPEGESIPEITGDAASEEAPVSAFSAAEELEQEQVFAHDQSRQSQPESSQSPQPSVEDREPQTGMSEKTDPLVTQLALSLTQASLELTADATLLAHNDKIVAYAGSMPIEDIEDLRAGIADDWEAKPGEARIRFVTLPSSGQDFMLYSRRTAEGFTLSMIFSGNTPLRVIRRQCDRLINALNVVPGFAAGETPSLLDDLRDRARTDSGIFEERTVTHDDIVPESPPQLQVEQFVRDLEEAGPRLAAEIEEILPAPTAYAGPLAAHTYLWLIRDVNRPLPDDVAHTMKTELDQQLKSLGWDVNNLEVAEDYVYLWANVPAEKPVQEIVGDLKQRTALIVGSMDKTLTPEELWADSYAVLTPGRAMDTEEIQRFINFGRAH